MSQGSQGPFAAGRTILPLAKFSYATVHGKAKTPIPWFHMGRTENLFAIFESQHVEDDKGQARDVKKFRVLNDPEVLEDIDLDVLASEANRARAEAQDARTNDKLVTIIIKIPCIAIRYPLQGGKIRRIQIRLASNDDYFETLKILTRANVPLSDAGSFPIQLQPARPFSSSSSLLRPSESASQFGPRPVSMSSRIGDLPSVNGDVGVEWTSAHSVRPTTSSGPLHGIMSGEISDYIGQSGRSPAILGNSSMHFNDAPPMRSAASGAVSGYFGGLAELHSLRPPQAVGLEYVISPGRIDLFQPRPSTAPMMESQSLNQMLPPKRELPFSIPAPTKKMRTALAQIEKVHANTEPGAPKLQTSSLPDFNELKSSFLDAVSATETTREVSVISAATVPTTKGKRVVATRVPKPRAPKKQQTKVPPKVLAKVPAKSAAKAVTMKDLVPGVDQLFIETDHPSRETMGFIPTIDTQALLSRVNATRLHESIELPELVNEVRSILSNPSTASSQTRKCSCCRTRKGKCNGKDPCDWCTDQDVTCTYEAPTNLASQVLVPSSQPVAVTEAARKASPAVEDNATEPSQKVALQEEAVVAAHKAAAQEAPRAEDLISREIPHQDATPTRMSKAQSIDPDTSLIGEAPFPQDAGPTPALHFGPAPAPDPLALLHREPTFAQSSQLGSWANLPEPLQRSSLETWMCQQINDPGFIALVKRLDESWQTNLFSMSVGMDT